MRKRIASWKETEVLVVALALVFAASYSVNISTKTENRVTGLATGDSVLYNVPELRLVVTPETGIRAGTTINIASVSRQKLAAHRLVVEAYNPDGFLRYAEVVRDCTESYGGVSYFLQRAPQSCGSSFTIPQNWANLNLRVISEATTIKYSILLSPSFQTGIGTFREIKSFQLPAPSNDQCGSYYNDATCDDTAENCGAAYVAGTSLESCRECSTGGFDCAHPCDVYKLDNICDDTQQACGNAYTPSKSIAACNECSTGGFNCQNPCSQYFGDDICDDTQQNCGVVYIAGTSDSSCGECSNGGFDCAHPCQIYYGDKICDDTEGKCGAAYIAGSSIVTCGECSNGGFNCSTPCQAYYGDDVCDDTRQYCKQAYESGLSLDTCGECAKGGYPCNLVGELNEYGVGPISPQSGPLYVACPGFNPAAYQKPDYIADSIGCGSIYGVCAAFSGFREGVKVSGKFVPGLCPGPSFIQCCVIEEPDCTTAQTPECVAVRQKICREAINNEVCDDTKPNCESKGARFIEGYSNNYCKECSDPLNTDCRSI